MELSAALPDMDTRNNEESAAMYGSASRDWSVIFSVRDVVTDADVDTQLALPVASDVAGAENAAAHQCVGRQHLW